MNNFGNISPLELKFDLFLEGFRYFQKSFLDWHYFLFKTKNSHIESFWIGLQTPYINFKSRHQCSLLYMSMYDHDLEPITVRELDKQVTNIFWFEKLNTYF